MNGKREMTIEEMIAAGVPWDQIQAKILKLQNEQKQKQVAAEQAKKEAEQKQKDAAVAQAQAEVARAKFLAAFADWMIAEGLIEAQERPEVIETIGEIADDLLKKLKTEIALMSILSGLGLR